MKCNLCTGSKGTASPSDCFTELLDQIKIHFFAFAKKNNANEMRVQTLEDLNSDYKRQLDILAKRNDTLHLQIESMRTPKKRKKTTSMDIVDDEDALTDNDLNVAVHSQNLFDDSSVQVLSPRNVSVGNNSNRKSSNTPKKSESPQLLYNFFNKTPKKVSPVGPCSIFNKTPRKVSPADPKTTNLETPSKNETPNSKANRTLALYSPTSKRILASPAKCLPKRVPIKSGWTTKRTTSSSNLKNSMSFINNSNKENKALIQSRLVFPKHDGNSLILDSEEETFCDEIQSSQKSPGPRHNKSKRLKKPTGSVSKCLSSNFFNRIKDSKKINEGSVQQNEELPALIKQEPPEYDENDDSNAADLLADVSNQGGGNKSSDLEIVDEEESYNIRSMDLLADLMNQEGTENLHYMKSLSDAAAKKIQKRNEAKVLRSLSLQKPPSEAPSTSTPKPGSKKISVPFENPALLKVKEEPIHESMDSTGEIWDKFENNVESPALLKVKKEPIDKSVDSVNEIWNNFEKNDVDVVKKKPIVSVSYPEMPTVLQKIIIPKKRTFEDCPDCLQFIKDYGKEFSKEVINKRIEKCTRHNRNEDDLNLTPEGLWDPFMTSLPADDRRKEVFLDYRLVNQKK